MRWPAWFAAAAIVGFVLWQVAMPRRTPAPVQDSVVAAPPATPAVAVRHPVAAIGGAMPAPPLTVAAGTEDVVTVDGDASATVPTAAAATPVEPLAAGLARLLGAERLAAFMLDEDLVRHLVVSIDNLPARRLPRRQLPLVAVGGAFVVAGRPGGDGFEMAAENAARYQPWMDLLQDLDLPALVSLYVAHYAAFQDAYAEIAPAGAYFNDRLVDVVDHLLAFDYPTGPLRLERPGVFYRYADAALEARSAGHRILLRLGPTHAAVVAARLHELRALLTGATP